MSQPQMMVFGGKREKKPGRPRAPEPGSTVSTWIPVSDHDALVKLANQRDMTVSAFVRIVLLKEVSGQ